MGKNPPKKCLFLRPGFEIVTRIYCQTTNNNHKVSTNLTKDFLDWDVAIGREKIMIWLKSYYVNPPPE
jgi:hypothetical protein